MSLTTSMKASESYTNLHRQMYNFQHAWCLRVSTCSNIGTCKLWNEYKGFQGATPLFSAHEFQMHWENGLEVMKPMQRVTRSNVIWTHEFRIHEENGPHEFNKRIQKEDWMVIPVGSHSFVTESYHNGKNVSLMHWRITFTVRSTCVHMCVFTYCRLQMIFKL